MEAIGAEVGDMQAFLALTELELRERLRAPHARGYPARIFLSYKRATPDDIAWCVKLADALTANGYDVLIDERVVGTLASASLSEELAHFIASMADADVALIVVSDTYLTTGEPNAMPTWIYEEWLRIQQLSACGLLETVIVHRGGDFATDSTVVKAPGASDAYLDLRSNPADMTPVLDFFGIYDGPRVSPEDRARLGHHAAVAVSTAGAAGDPAAAARAQEAFAAIGDLEGTEEWGVAAAHALAASGDRVNARVLALTTLNQNPTLPSAFLLAKLLWLLDFDREAFAELAAQSEGRSRRRHQMKAMMADVLRRCGHPISARNQLRWCVTAKDQPDLGGRWSQFDGDGLALAQSQLDELEAAVGPVPGINCRSCTASYPAGWLVCPHCATTRPPGEPCGMCAGEPRIMEDPTTLGFCPVCRRTSGAEPGNALIVPREPRGRFSVLAPRR